MRWNELAMLMQSPWNESSCKAHAKTRDKIDEWKLWLINESFGWNWSMKAHAKTRDKWHTHISHQSTSESLLLLLLLLNIIAAGAAESMGIAAGSSIGLPQKGIMLGCIQQIQHTRHIQPIHTVWEKRRAYMSFHIVHGQICHISQQHLVDIAQLHRDHHILLWYHYNCVQ